MEIVTSTLVGFFCGVTWLALIVDPSALKREITRQQNEIEDLKRSKPVVETKTQAATKDADLVMGLLDSQVRALAASTDLERLKTREDFEKHAAKIHAVALCILKSV